MKDYLQTMDYPEDNEAVLLVYGCSSHPDACLVYTVTSLIKPVSHCIIPEMQCYFQIYLIHPVYIILTF